LRGDSWYYIGRFGCGLLPQENKEDRWQRLKLSHRLGQSQRTNSADIQSTLTNTNRGNQKEDKVEGLLPTNTKEIPSAWRFHRCGFFVYRWTKFGSPKVDADLWRCWCIGKVHHKLLHG
jgi:hypothetical protein